MDWVKIAVKEIVGFYSINPATLAGSIREGPYLAGYSGIDNMSEDQIERFCRLFQVFATHVFASLHEQLSHVASQAIDKGYTDIVCNLFDYRVGMLVLEVEAVGCNDDEEVDSMIERAKRNTSY